MIEKWEPCLYKGSFGYLQLHSQVIQNDGSKQIVVDSLNFLSSLKLPWYGQTK